MEIYKAHIESFKSIDSLDLNFKDYVGLWELSGPVGSGKTSVAEALIFGLYGSVRDKSIKDLLKWGASRCEVSLNVVSKGKNIVIVRDILKTGAMHLKVTVDGSPLLSTNKRDMQTTLEKDYYDVSRLTLESLCLISFNSFKSLMHMTPGDTRKFIDQTFMLDVLNTWCERCADNKREESSKLSDVRRDIDINKSIVSKIDKWRERSSNVVEESFDELESERRELENMLSDRDSEYREKTIELDDKIRQLSVSIGEVTSEGKRVKRDIDFMSKGVCPTCGAKLDVSSLGDRLKERERLIESFNSLRHSMGVLEGEKNELRLSYFSGIEDIKRRLSEVSEKIVVLREQSESSKFQDSEKRDAEEALDGLMREERRLESEVEDWDAMSKMCSNEFRGVVMKSVMPSISDAVNRCLVSLDQPYVVTLDECFNCSVSVSDRDSVPLSSLSTGQSKMIDMAVILGVLEVLMGSVSFNVFFLDELLSNMDEELRGKMCATIRDSLSGDKSVFIVCHASLCSESLSGKLSVRNESGSSVFERC